MFSHRINRQLALSLLTLVLAGSALAQPPSLPDAAPNADVTPETAAASDPVGADRTRQSTQASDTDWQAQSNPLNDLVRILAGLEVSARSPYADLMASGAWRNYHLRIQETWQRYNTQQHDKVEAFRDQWLPPATHQDRDLLYPFAAADFLYADLFFPQASNIYMFGLEPLGEIPGRERLNRAYYAGVIRATEDLLRLTFFRTKAMREDFRHNGTVPLLCYFIVHRGHMIQDIVYLRLDDDGVPHQAPLAEAEGARIAFQDGRSGRMRSVWYWRGDLGNQGLAKHPGLAAYIAGLPTSNLYMKAASYLCHHQGFEDACRLFRDRAALSLQEDSGMPLRFFPEEDWTWTFFGQYRDPISVFTDRLYRQGNALRQAFATADRVHELPFPLGYHASARADNLMLAIRADRTEDSPAAPSARLALDPTANPRANKAPERQAEAETSDQPVARAPAAAEDREPSSTANPEPAPEVARVSPNPAAPPAPEPTAPEPTDDGSTPDRATTPTAEPRVVEDSPNPAAQPMPEPADTEPTDTKPTDTRATEAAAQPPAAPTAQLATAATATPAPSARTDREIPPPDSSPGHEEGPISLEQQLDAAGIAYKINDSGIIWFIQSVNESRTQLTFIAPESEPTTAGLPMREIWSVGYLSEDDALSIDTASQLLKENATTNVGAWELGRFLGKAAGIFRARIPADADWRTLSKAAQLVASVADHKERTLMGSDEL